MIKFKEIQMLKHECKLSLFAEDNSLLLGETKRLHSEIIETHDTKIYKE